MFDTGAKPTQPSAPQPTTSSAPGKLPVVSEVVVRDSKLAYRDGRTRQVSELDLQRVSLRANSDNDPLKIDVDGAFNGHSFQVVGQVGAIAALTRAGTPYPVSLVVRSPEAGTIKVDGQIKEPMTGKGYELAVAAEGNEIAKLAELGGVKVPLLGPFKAELKLTDGAPGGNPSVPSLKVDLGKPELVLVRAQGAVRDPIGQKGIAITVSVEGREIGAFSGLALPGMAAPVPPIPALGPFRATVRVTEGPAGRPAIPELKAELGRRRAHSRDDRGRDPGSAAAARHQHRDRRGLDGSRGAGHQDGHGDAGHRADDAAGANQRHRAGALRAERRQAECRRQRRGGRGDLVDGRRAAEFHRRFRLHFGRSHQGWRRHTAEGKPAPARQRRASPATARCSATIRCPTTCSTWPMASSNIARPRFSRPASRCRISTSRPICAAGNSRCGR